MPEPAMLGALSLAGWEVIRGGVRRVRGDAPFWMEFVFWLGFVVLVTWGFTHSETRGEQAGWLLLLAFVLVLVVQLGRDRPPRKEKEGEGA